MNTHVDVDLYAVLGVATTATDAEIQKAYKKLAREWHPDINDADGAEERFKEISGAYDVLGDAEKRAEYDEFRRMVGQRGFGGPTSNGHAASGYGPPGGGETFDLNDLLGGMFGDRMAGGHGFAMRGHDLDASMSLSFDDAVRGTTVTLTVDGRAVTARIPAGVTDGQKIRLAGKGGAGHGAPDGDLYLHLSVGGHPHFGRTGKHLTTTATISWPDAVLGADLAVQTYDGDTVKLRVPSGTSHGQTLRAKGKGVGEGSDLLVTLAIEVPDPNTLTEDQRFTLEALQDALGTDSAG